MLDQYFLYFFTLNKESNTLIIKIILVKQDKSNHTLLDKTYENIIKSEPNKEILAIINHQSGGTNPTFVTANAATTVAIFARYISIFSKFPL